MALRDLDAEIRRMAAAGKRDKEIGEKLGYTQSTIQWYRSEHKIKAVYKRTLPKKSVARKKQDTQPKRTLCWDCARASGNKEIGCSWSKHLEEVAGAVVDERKDIVSCPQFLRDAYNGGSVRCKKAQLKVRAK